MGRTRANGSGSISVYRDGFRLRWTMPDGTTGSEVMRSTTKTAALARLGDIQTDIRRGTFYDDRKGNVPFSEFAREWMEYREPAVSLGTFRNYQSLMNTTLLPTFGKMTLGAITRRHVDMWWSRQSARPVNRRNAAYMLSGIFDRAVDWELVPVSPVRIKNMGKDESMPRPDWTVADFDAVLAEVHPFYRAPCEVMFASHARLGELIALNGSDYSKGFVTINKQITDAGLLTNTKTGQHRTTELLQRGKDALAARPAVIGATPLFAGMRAYRMPRQSLQDAWHDAAVAAKKPGFVVHDIRHVSLSLLADSGASQAIIKERAGHASMSSQRRYLHTSVESHREAVEAVEALLRRRSS